MFVWFLCVAYHIIMVSKDIVYYTLYIPDKFVKHPKRDITLYFQFKSEVIFSIYRYVPIILYARYCPIIQLIKPILNLSSIGLLCICFQQIIHIANGLQ